MSWSGPADRVIFAVIAARLLVTPGSRSRRAPQSTQQPRPCGAPAAVGGEQDPLRALSELILGNSDDDAAWAVSVSRPPAGGFEVPLIVVAGASDSVETETADDASRDRQGRSRAALEALPDGVAILSSIRDQSGRITDFSYEYVNEALAGRLGVSPGQLIGKQMREVFPAEVESGVFADCCELVEPAEPLTREDVALGADCGVRRISDGLDLHGGSSATVSFWCRARSSGARMPARSALSSRRLSIPATTR